MLVRYFAAASAAAGVQEEHFDLPEGTTFEELIAAILAVERCDGYSAGTPSLAGVIPQCSFLRNEVALRDRSAALRLGDVIDILPPFAGG
jgi:molybdopterin synthase sulfur carrier subunit